MTATDLADLLIGALQGLGATSVFLLALFIGFCVVAGFSKLRPTGRQTKTVRSLDELVGRTGESDYYRPLPPDAPRGRVDQLRTPELLEKKTA